MNTRTIGSFGEKIAAKYLISKGYKILLSNWTCYAGEIDLITRNPNGMLTFVEVKYIRNKFCLPENLFNYKKKKHLRRTIGQYLGSHQFETWSFDLICISGVYPKVQVNHYKNLPL
ncbi:hypothetical protein A3K42_01770 [candidate division WWE3 bacterium RBG_13_37_7]|uniref:UPF0102 protein A3K42_01770 n=1 Tax=candidate division WWE3 bacterium RBG_13_37_7 TaxID=1802609 RepID=A0A1F4U1C4_UNCKA|nr:MAG: hypothetical protein A3K42_01770 [candidate division WWE3 bacterium RBG_13_37_7]